MIGLIVGAAIVGGIVIFVMSGIPVKEQQEYDSVQTQEQKAEAEVR